ncbi:GntR family transcriptional regulator [Agromyces sp. NPDC127015]|uniref:GntR family transcriptional regulator n=1 Tax=Agromyces sp. NPDC127015 TaxID=3347108 RepID=UPI0036618151
MHEDDVGDAVFDVHVSSFRSGRSAGGLRSCDATTAIRNILHVARSAPGPSIDLPPRAGVWAIYCMPIPRSAPGVDRSLLRDDVFRRLRDAIVDGTFLPGEQLKDVDLAEWLGVSRTPVREALLRLGASGLVVAVPGRSTTVSAIDPKAVRDARDVVAAMHVLVARETAGNLSDAEVARMREANGRFARAVGAGDTAAALDADDELHSVPVSSLGNHAIESVLDQFGPVVRRSERDRFAADGPASIERHERLIQLLTDGDAEGAAELTFEIWHSLPSENGTPAG